ncbi:MAG: hypothetical protein EXR70_17305 [Deltaproteobacteria bacterium]|nr:hypothetical protein [Deltaproteobacteria bacterium]
MPAPAPLEKSDGLKPEPPIEIAKLPDDKSPSLPPIKPAIPRTLPESLIGAPEKESASRRLEYNTLLSSRTIDPVVRSGWNYRRTSAGAIVGFEFSNHGGNRILPTRRDVVKNQFFTRDFQFRFDERARQDIHLLVTDWVPSRDRQFRLSELMQSLFYFFPRSFLPAIVNDTERNLITLPTGEEVEFDARSHEIVGGGLSEAPVDLNPDRSARQFPAVEYRGKGVVVRANARGSDPRLSGMATITSGMPTNNCEKGIGCNRCQLPVRELWDQSGALRFKFAGDQEFDKFLLARCQFGLPKNDTGYALTLAK